MDENDKNILRHLMDDGRKSNVDSADSMGVSEEIVRRRKFCLQQERAYEIVAVPDHRKLGYGVEILLGIEADSSQTDEVAEALSEVDEVYRVSCTTGSFNIFAWLTVRSMEDVAAVLDEKVRSIPGIDRVSTFCCIEPKKPWTPTVPRPFPHNERPESAMP